MRSTRESVAVSHLARRRKYSPDLSPSHASRAHPVSIVSGCEFALAFLVFFEELTFEIRHLITHRYIAQKWLTIPHLRPCLMKHFKTKSPCNRPASFRKIDYRSNVRAVFGCDQLKTRSRNGIALKAALEVSASFATSANVGFLHSSWDLECLLASPNRHQSILLGRRWPTAHTPGVPVEMEHEIHAHIV